LNAVLVLQGTIVTNPSFLTLGIAEPLRRALAADHYLQPTPIQAQAIPALLAGRDVLGLAQTGTGKTAAFGLPLLQKLYLDRKPAGQRSARALILAPTRELAIQIDESLKSYGRHLKLRHAVIMGGMSESKQIGAMRQGVDILVATPGRLLDLIGQKHVNLGGVTTLVVDEADRMFDMGFIRDVRRIVACLPRQRQSMLFSATMPAEVAHLVAEMLRDPIRIDVSPATLTAEGIDQFVYFVESKEKQALLHNLLRDPEMKRAIVFTRTKHGANKVAKRLSDVGHAAEAIHGNKSQNARQRALEGFRSGRARVLVATDIAARGIDIDEVTHIVNFELPEVPETYVHRIGRTARAGSGGVAISFCDGSERDSLRSIERLVKQRLTAMNGPQLLPDRAPDPQHKPNRSNMHPRPRKGRANATFDRSSRTGMRAGPPS
jgi:ATP-dependent RNA helicase RhlE